MNCSKVYSSTLSRIIKLRKSKIENWKSNLHFLCRPFAVGSYSDHFLSTDKRTRGGRTEGRTPFHEVRVCSSTSTSLCRVQCPVHNFFVFFHCKLFCIRAHQGLFEDLLSIRISNHQSAERVASKLRCVGTAPCVGTLFEMTPFHANRNMKESAYVV